MATQKGEPVKLASEYEGRPGAVLARLQDLYPKLIDLSLDRLEVLLAKLGHPERALPPSFTWRAPMAKAAPAQISAPSRKKQACASTS